MAKKLLLSLSVLVVLFGVVLLVAGIIRQKQQKAIMAVINQSNAACVQTRTLPNGDTITRRSGQRGFLMPEYIKAVERIPTVDCPQQFQVAWMNYVQTLQRGDQPFAGLGAVVEYEISVIHPSADASKDALARLDRLNASEAWRRVVMVALHCGVQIYNK